MTTAKRRPTVRLDPTVYPVDDGMGEGLLQRLISEQLRQLIARYLAESGVVALTGANQFIYWEQHKPTSSVCPDVYVLSGVAPDADVKSWKVWEHDGRVPSFALEIVSSDKLKDYEEAPRRYQALGVSEAVIFDPESDGTDRVRWQLFRRMKRGFVLVEASNGDRVFSKALGSYLRVEGQGASTRVRLGTGKQGHDLVPTDSERAERERAEKERERAEKERERAEKEALLARVRELESALEKKTPRR
jgi:Uma2 family endonuclease